MVFKKYFTYEEFYPQTTADSMCVCLVTEGYVFHLWHDDKKIADKCNATQLSAPTLETCFMYGVVYKLYM